MRWIGLKTIVVRECGVIAQFWSFTLAPPAVTTILYFAVFGAIVGKRVGALEGFDYLQYMAPGLIILWVIPYSFGHTAAGFLGARFFKYIEEIQVAPLPDWIIMSGYVIGGVIRGLLVGVIAIITTLLFTRLHIHSLIISIAILLLAALVSALGGFITALFVKSFDQVSMIQSSILTPLVYLGGVFNPVALLPDWARQLSLANPVFYMVNAFRYGFLGVTDMPLGVAVSVMLVCGLVLFLIVMGLMARGVGMRD